MARNDPLTALAHPLRSRLHTALREGGPATATGLATHLGTNSGATSYHLRELAKAGLIEEVPGGGGRQRRWSALPPPPLRTAELEGDADASAMLAWLDHDLARHTAGQHEQWLTASGRWPGTWRRAAGQREGVVLVTAEQLAALQEELAAVLRRFARVGQGNPDARRVAAYVLALPLDLDRPPRG